MGCSRQTRFDFDPMYNYNKSSYLRYGPVDGGAYLYDINTSNRSDQTEVSIHKKGNFIYIPNSRKIAVVDYARNEMISQNYLSRNTVYSVTKDAQFADSLIYYSKYGSVYQVRLDGLFMKKYVFTAGWQLYNNEWIGVVSEKAPYDKFKLIREVIVGNKYRVWEVDLESQFIDKLLVADSSIFCFGTASSNELEYDRYNLNGEKISNGTLKGAYNQFYNIGDWSEVPREQLYAVGDGVLGVEIEEGQLEYVIRKHSIKDLKMEWELSIDDSLQKMIEYVDELPIVVSSDKFHYLLTNNHNYNDFAVHKVAYDGKLIESHVYGSPYTIDVVHAATIGDNGELIMVKSSKTLNEGANDGDEYFRQTYNVIWKSFE